MESDGKQKEPTMQTQGVHSATTVIHVAKQDTCTVQTNRLDDLEITIKLRAHLT